MRGNGFLTVSSFEVSRSRVLSSGWQRSSTRATRLTTNSSARSSSSRQLRVGDLRLDHPELRSDGGGLRFLGAERRAEAVHLSERHARRAPGTAGPTGSGTPCSRSSRSRTGSRSPRRRRGQDGRIDQDPERVSQGIRDFFYERGFGPDRFSHPDPAAARGPRPCSRPTTSGARRT